MNAHLQDSRTVPYAAGRLAHFPVALFAAVMGTSGLALAWQRAHAVFGAPAVVGGAVRLLASVLFVVLTVLYAAKWLRHPQAALAESRHPVRINFVSTVSIAMMLVSTSWLEDAPGAAAAGWAAGAMLHLALTVRTVGSWIQHPHYNINHASPAWFIPAVGNIVVPIAGARIAPQEISWFFFSGGIAFWGILLTIVMHRLFFHDPLPERMVPTMFILFAPPAVGFIAWTSLAGEVDAFGRLLFYLALFMALLVAGRPMRFLRLPFFVSSWAYSFPLAALTIAAMTMYERAGGRVLATLALSLLAVLSVVLALLGARTAVAAWRNQICVPE